MPCGVGSAGPFNWMQTTVQRLLPVCVVCLSFCFPPIESHVCRDSRSWPSAAVYEAPGFLCVSRNCQAGVLRVATCTADGSRSAGLPVKWDHLVTFKVTKAMAKTMKDCPPVEVKLLKFPAYVAGNQIASGFLDVDAYLWQEGPISARVLLADSLDQPVLELATSCHYEPPTGCRHMASRSPTKVMLFELPPFQACLEVP